MREDFCAFILTHGRPYTVHTFRTLRTHGYTGRILIVIDDEDEAMGEYKRIFGDDVLVFSKDEVGRYTDQFDNFSGRRSVLWARNACWGLARQVGYRYFIQLDDDFTGWGYRRRGKGHSLSSSVQEEYHEWRISSLDAVFEALARLIETTPVQTIAFSQGGDHIGGAEKRLRFRRKAMNSFVCSTERPFLFRGRFNDDVTTYTFLGRAGGLFFTDMQLELHQLQSQLNPGGMSEAYLDFGTYVKSFYTVMAAPSCATIAPIGGAGSGAAHPNTRLHHRINWDKAVPLILTAGIGPCGYRGDDVTVGNVPGESVPVEKSRKYRRGS